MADYDCVLTADHANLRQMKLSAYNEISLSVISFLERHAGISDVQVLPAATAAPPYC